jgi:hypothetical protein
VAHLTHPAHNLFPQLERSLEDLVDRHGLTLVTDVLVTVCGYKAEQLRCNWQDDHAAAAWDKCARTLDKASLAICKALP